jgi:sarcosine oxidase subunit gamma
MIDAPDVTIVERPFRPIYNVRADVADPTLREALFGTTGLAWPAPNRFEARDRIVLAWLGPDEFLLIDQAGADVDVRTSAERDEALRAGLASRLHAFTAVGNGFTTLEVTGDGACDVLARGCALDLHPRVFREGDCRQTMYAKTVVALIHRGSGSDGLRIEMIVRRSFADHVWRWLAANCAGIRSP